MNTCMYLYCMYYISLAIICYIINVGTTSTTLEATIFYRENARIIKKDAGSRLS